MPGEDIFYNGPGPALFLLMAGVGVVVVLVGVFLVLRSVPAFGNQGSILYCRTCGQGSPQGTRFCPKCGAELQ